MRARAVYKTQFLSLEFYEKVELEMDVADHLSAREIVYAWLEPLRPTNLQRASIMWQQHHDQVSPRATAVPYSQLRTSAPAISINGNSVDRGSDGAMYPKRSVAFHDEAAHGLSHPAPGPSPEPRPGEVVA